MNDWLNVLLKDLDIDKSNVTEFDINNEEDLQNLVNEVNELKDNPLFSLVSSLFGLTPNDIDNALKEAQRNNKIKRNNKIEQNSKKVPEVIRKEIDKSEEIDRPSQHINTQAGLQIHKLVQEYVDTMIKPYNNNHLTQQQMNDAYAGLYEFACWIYNHK